MRLTIWELDDLSIKMQRMFGEEDTLLRLLTYANRTDRLEEMLAAVGLSDLCPGTACSSGSARKIVVLGASEVTVGVLRSVADKAGFERSDVEYCLDYDKLDHYNFAKLRDKDVYKAVLFGPGPHSTPGKGESSSALDEMRSHPEIYPRVVEVRERGGALKITRNSFRQAILKVAS